MTIETAAKELRDAQDKFSIADRAYDTASRARTEALNALNKAQKGFDEAVAGVRANANYSTDWGRREVS